MRNTATSLFPQKQANDYSYGRTQHEINQYRHRINCALNLSLRQFQISDTAPGDELLELNDELIDELELSELNDDKLLEIDELELIELSELSDDRLLLIDEDELTELRDDRLDEIDELELTELNDDRLLEIDEDELTELSDDRLLEIDDKEEPELIDVSSRNTNSFLTRRGYGCLDLVLQYDCPNR